MIDGTNRSAQLRQATREFYMSEGDGDLPTAPQEIGTFTPFGEFDESLNSGHTQGLGIDSGATLLKLCHHGPDGSLHFATWPSPSIDRVLALVERLEPRTLGVTGCGAAKICEELGRKDASLVEFDAWARGAREMLDVAGLGQEGPFLLVSVGTGTTMLRVDGDQVERVGGTALGGGTLQGLGFALTGIRRHEELIALAAEGERGRVDLLIGDLFDDEAAPLMAQATASSFAKLGRGADAESTETETETETTRKDESSDPRREDLAAATLGLVAENIGLMANARASAATVTRIVYGGSTLNNNPHVADIVRGIGLVMGFDALVLPRGGHAGALGALRLGS
jgi:type II pantothenate kinase